MYLFLILLVDFHFSCGVSLFFKFVCAFSVDTSLYPRFVYFANVVSICCYVLRVCSSSVARGLYVFSMAMQCVNGTSKLHVLVFEASTSRK